MRHTTARGKARARSARRAQLHGQRASAGFTLIEVVLAAGLFVMGMSMILGVYSFGSALSRTAELRAISASTVDAIVADLEATLFPLREDGYAGAPVEIEGRPVPGHRGVSYSVETLPNTDTLEVLSGIEEPVAREYAVTITAQWNSSGVKRTATWSTIMLREIPFGARMRQRFVPSGAGGA